MKLSVENVSAGYRHKTIVRDVSMTIESGEVLCLLGANGSGKTTLFKTVLHLLKLHGGRICIDGKDTASWPHRRLSQVLAYVPQAHTPPFAFTVRDVVVMARSAHLRAFASPGKKDLDIAEESLQRLGIGRMADEPYTEISGGERQLVLIARALAQQPRFLVLDEPTSNLDFANQFLVLRQVKELASSGLGILMTTHMPDHAFYCASRVALMKAGRILALCAPEKALTASSLSMAYEFPLRVVEPEPNLRMVVPHVH